MKYLLLALVVVLFSAPTQAQTLVSKDAANKYFASCIAQPPSEQFSKQSQNTFCACTAARMTQFFYVEDMLAMTGPDPVAARPAYNKMIVHLYAPCMELPSQEHFYNTCINNPDSAAYADREGTCQCLGKSIGLHFKLHGPEIFRNVLATNPNVVDPMAAAYQDPAFTKFAQEKLVTCLK